MKTPKSFVALTARVAKTISASRTGRSAEGEVSDDERSPRRDLHGCSYLSSCYSLLQMKQLRAMSRPRFRPCASSGKSRSIQKAQEQVDRSVRDEISRNRLEQIQPS